MDNTFTAMFSDRRVRLGLIVALILLGLFVAGRILLNSDDFRVTNLHIDSSNQSVAFDGQSIQAFNGAFFYKIPLDSRSGVKILGGGVKLPGITKAIWAGDRGVILNFDESYIHTPVETIAASKHLSYDQQRQSTWYFDFSSNTLLYLGNYTIGDSAYLTDNNTVYFTTSETGRFKLHTFNALTRKDSTLRIPLDLSSVSSIGKCPSSNTICLVGSRESSPAQTGVFSVDSRGETKELLSVKGKLYPLSGFDKYIVLDESNDVSDSGEGSMPAFSKATIFDLSQKKAIGEINKTFAPDSFLYTSKDDKIILVGDSVAGYITVQKHLWFDWISDNSLRYTNGDNFDWAPVINSSMTPSGILFTASDKQYNLLTDKSLIKADFSPHPSKDTVSAATTCAAMVKSSKTQYDASSQQITILLPDNNAFASNVSNVSNCLAKTPAYIHGYNFSFTSYDTVSGRVTSY